MPSARAANCYTALPPEGNWLAPMLAMLTGQDCVVDGEIVAFASSQTSFARLQLRAQQHDPEQVRYSPVVDHRIEPHGHWVRPEHIAQVAFTEWTRDGRLRHPRFLGLRDDKPAQAVIRGRPHSAGPAG